MGFWFISTLTLWSLTCATCPKNLKIGISDLVVYTTTLVIDFNFWQFVCKCWCLEAKTWFRVFASQSKKKFIFKFSMYSFGNIKKYFMHDTSHWKVINWNMQKWVSRITVERNPYSFTRLYIEPSDGNNFSDVYLAGYLTVILAVLISLWGPGSKTLC